MAKRHKKVFSVESPRKVNPILKRLEGRTALVVDRDGFYTRFQRLKPKPKLHKKPRQESLVVNKGGKGAAVRHRMPDGKIIDVCECKHNVDFARGCIGQVHGSLLEEVIQSGGVYESDLHFRIYKAAGFADQRCDYCYAFRNTGNVFPRQVNEKTRASFEKHEPDVIRLGKLTEAGHPYHFLSLMNFFELCKEFGSRIIFPTKMFPFGIEGALETTNLAFRNLSTVADLAKARGMYSGGDISDILKGINATLLYSIGYNSEENGAVTQGFTNEWRIRQAEAYLKQGVNVSLTVVCDVAQSIDANVERGSAVKIALESHERTGINFRLLPLRPTSKAVLARLGCGKAGDVVLRGQTLWFPMMDRVDFYVRRGNNEYVPLKIHSDFKELYESGIGMCGVAEELEHCDKCNLWPGSPVRIEFPESELAPVDYSEKPSKPYGGNKK